MTGKSKRRVLRLAPQDAPGCANCDLTVDTVDFFRDWFQKEMEKYPESEVTLDLRSVSQIDSMGISLVVGLFRECETAGRRFSVETGFGEVHQMFTMLNLDHVFPIRHFSS